MVRMEVNIKKLESDRGNTKKTNAKGLLGFPKFAEKRRRSHEKTNIIFAFSSYDDAVTDAHSGTGSAG